MVNAFRWMVFVIVLAVVIGSIMITTGEPILDIDSHYDGEIVTSEKITVYGHVRGTGGVPVESVTVNGIKATGDPEWSAEVSLHPGSNPITVVATDDMGQSSSETITVICNPPTTPTQTPIYDGAPSAIPTPTPTLTGSITITTSPPGAEVYLDNSPTKRITPATLENVTVGHHKIKVSKEGYRSETRKIYLGAGITRELNIELEPITGSIFVCSTPPGASVYLDDDDMKAITPSMLSEVLIGQHSIKLTKSDYFDVTRNVSVSVGRTSNLNEKLTGYGSIDISSDPSGANVHLDGDCKGETPLGIDKVVVGDHTIKLTKVDYDDVIRNVSLSVGETRHLNENLTGYGSLCISSAPSCASVYVDDAYEGDTPLLIRKVVVGWHSCRLTKTDYEDVAKMIQVSAGIVTDVDESFSSGLPPSLEYKLAIAVGIIGILSLIGAVLFEYRKKILNWINGRLERRRINR